MKDASALHERQLQRGVQRLLSDPARVWKTVDGADVQVLSPGRLNPHEGPDFLTVALFLRGEVRLGDAEFHRSTGDWHAHGHSADPRYTNVILHIVTRNDAPPPDGAETLVLQADDIAAAQAAPQEQTQDDGTELQHYALLRMLRKTAECAALLKQYDPAAAFAGYAAKFLASLAKKRRRPVHSAEELADIAALLPASGMARLVQRAADGGEPDFTAEMAAILRQSIGAEGKHLRHEIAVNCFLPMMLAAANERLRTQIFLWYWSVGAANAYGVLARRFPAIPQRFFWQQQGMLEYIREHGSRGNIAAEAVLRYGFAEALHFYKHAASPVADEVIVMADRAEPDDEPYPDDEAEDE